MNQNSPNAVIISATYITTSIIKPRLKYIKIDSLQVMATSTSLSHSYPTIHSPIIIFYLSAINEKNLNNATLS